MSDTFYKCGCGVEEYRRGQGDQWEICTECGCEITLAGYTED